MDCFAEVFLYFCCVFSFFFEVCKYLLNQSSDVNSTLRLGFFDEYNRIMSLLLVKVRHDFSTPLMLAVEEVHKSTNHLLKECHWLGGCHGSWERLTDDLKSATGSPRCGKAAAEQWSNAMVQGHQS